jgi:hypothetical protein
MDLPTPQAAETSDHAIDELSSALREVRLKIHGEIVASITCWLVYLARLVYSTRPPRVGMGCQVSIIDTNPGAAVLTLLTSAQLYTIR